MHSMKRDPEIVRDFLDYELEATRHNADCWGVWYDHSWRWVNSSSPLGRARWGKQGSVYFKNIGFLNHACIPNAACTWDGHHCRMVILAIQPIRKGEEITVHYCPNEMVVPWPRVQRKSWVQSNLGFVCLCADCATPRSAEEAFRATAVDTQYNFVSHLLTQLRNREQPELYFHGLWTLLQMCEPFGVLSMPSRELIVSGVDWAARIGDRERTRGFAIYHKGSWLAVRGSPEEGSMASEEHFQAVKRVVYDPTSYDNFSNNPTGNADQICGKRVPDLSMAPEEWAPWLFMLGD